MHRTKYNIKEMERRLRDNLEDCINEMEEFVALNTSTIRNHQEESFDCKICKKKYTTRFNAEEHIRSKHYIYIYKYRCATCRKCFKRKDKHRHGNSNKPNFPEESIVLVVNSLLVGDRPFECPKCFRRFTSSVGYNYHLLKCTASKPTLKLDTESDGYMTEKYLDEPTNDETESMIEEYERVNSPSQHAENVDKLKPLKSILKRANVSPNDGKQAKRVRFILEETPKYTQIKSAEGGEPDLTGNGDDGIGNEGGEENGNGGDETGIENRIGTVDGTDNGDDNTTTQTIAEIPSAEVKDESSNNANFTGLMPNLRTICETVENLLKANAELESKLAEAKIELRHAAESRKEAEDIHKNEVKRLNEKATNLEANIVELQKEKVEEVKRAIENIKTDCETKSSKLIAEAKKKVYCVSCDAEKQDLFACNNECWKDYWGQHFKMNQTL